MQKFIMVVGIPGSGKSTYAKRHANNNTVILSSDSIRLELYGNEEIQGDSKQIFSILHDRMIQAIKSGFTVIYDTTNLRTINRLETLGLIKNFKIYKECIFFNISFNKALRNNKKRLRQVPEIVIKRMYNTMNEPQAEEGWDKIIKIF